MSTNFSRSMRSLERDGFRFTLANLFIAGLLLVGWGAWFFLATIPLYAVTETFYLDMNRTPTQIVAELDASEAANVRPHQRAWLRLTDTRALPATVTRVDELRVELTIDEDAGSLLSSQKHFRGRVEIEVERVTPSSLVLRSIGRD
jgi:hypothetical protein